MPIVIHLRPLDKLELQNCSRSCTKMNIQSPVVLANENRIKVKYPAIKAENLEVKLTHAPIATSTTANTNTTRLPPPDFTFSDSPP